MPGCYAMWRVPRDAKSAVRHGDVVRSGKVRQRLERDELYEQVEPGEPVSHSDGFEAAMHA